MTDPTTLLPAVSINVTIVIGLSLTISAAALGFLLRSLRRREKLRPARSQWQIDYRSSTGLTLRISKIPSPRPVADVSPGPPARDFPAQPGGRARPRAALRHRNRVRSLP
jgi:hypothetical protein